MVPMSIIDHFRIAFERGQFVQDCKECGGRGSFYGTIGSDDIDCAHCDGSGIRIGTCECGNRSALVPSSPHAKHEPEVRCPKCAVTCDLCCKTLSTHRDENGAQYCDDCHAFDESAGDELV